MATCDGCNKEIQSNENANVIALWGFVPKMFCNDCYASRERGIFRNYFYYPRTFPLNSTAYLLSLIASTILFLILIVVLAISADSSAAAKIIVSIILLAALLWHWILFVLAKNKLAALA